MTNENHVAALADSLPERLDAVVNNAGVAVAGPMEAVPLTDFRRQLDVNVVGQIAVTQAVLPRLRSFPRADRVHLQPQRTARRSR